MAMSLWFWVLFSASRSMHQGERDRGVVLRHDLPTRRSRCGTLARMPTSTTCLVTG